MDLFNKGRQVFNFVFMAKKIIAILGIISISFVLITPFLIAKADNITPGSIPESCTIRRTFTAGGQAFNKGDVIAAENAGISGAIEREDWGVVCLLNTIYFVTDWVFYILMLAVMVVILMGGFMFLTAGGSSEKVTKAGKLIGFAIVGLLIGLLAKIIPTIVKYMSGVGGGSSGGGGGPQVPY